MCNTKTKEEQKEIERIEFEYFNNSTELICKECGYKFKIYNQYYGRCPNCDKNYTLDYVE